MDGQTIGPPCALVLAVLLLALVGQATYYAPGVMEAVYEYRVRVGDVQPCPECVDNVALLEPEHIGRRVWLTPPGGEPIGPLLVVDCANAAHRAELAARGWAVDVSWQLGQRLGMRGPLAGVVVDFAPPGGRGYDGWAAGQATAGRLVWR